MAPRLSTVRAQNRENISTDHLVFSDKFSGIVLGFVCSYLLMLTCSAHFKLDRIADVMEYDSRNDSYNQTKMKNLNIKIARLQNFVNRFDCPSKSFIPTKKNIEKAINYHMAKYGADGGARVDFARESAGGKVIAVKDTKTYLKPTSLKKLAWAKYFTFACDQCHQATAILQPQVGLGDCWSFEGSRASIVIKLARKIYVDGITIDHIPLALSPSGNIKSAPRDIVVYGMKSIYDKDPEYFGNFQFDYNGPPIQTFDWNRSSVQYDLISMQIESNWGNPKYTSVYRVRIHGAID